MSGKRRKKQAPRRQPVRPSSAPVSPSASPDEGTATLSPAPAAAAPRSVSRAATTSRYAGSVTAPRRGGTAVASTGTIDIDERVPYFAKDLRRIVMTAGGMLLVIVAFSFLLH